MEGGGAGMGGVGNHDRLPWTFAHIGKRVEDDFSLFLSPGTLYDGHVSNEDWSMIYFLSFVLFPRHDLGLLQKGSKMRHLVHLTRQAYTSLIHHRPSGTFSSSNMSSSSCSSIVSGDLSLTYHTYRRWMHLGQTRSGSPTFLFLPYLIRFSDLIALDKGKGWASWPYHLRRRWGSSFPTSVSHAKVGVKPPCLGWRWGSGFLTSTPQAKVRVKHLDLPASVKAEDSYHFCYYVDALF